MSSETELERAVKQMLKDEHFEDVSGRGDGMYLVEPALWELLKKAMEDAQPH